jgi:hypothetical protein
MENPSALNPTGTVQGELNDNRRGVHRHGLAQEHQDS